MPFAAQAACANMSASVAPVYPAAGFLGQVKANGRALIEIDPSDTELSGLCDIVVWPTVAKALPRLVEALADRLSPLAGGSRHMEGSWHTE